MTIRQFSIKYGVPYPIAYGASYRVKPIATMEREKDFPERELHSEVVKVLKGRIEYHRLQLKRDLSILNGMEVKA